MSTLHFRIAAAPAALDLYRAAFDLAAQEAPMARVRTADAGTLTIEPRGDDWMVMRGGQDFAGPFSTQSAARGWLRSFRAYPF